MRLGKGCWEGMEIFFLSLRDQASTSTRAATGHTQRGKKGSAPCGKLCPTPNPTSYLLSTGTWKE